MSEPIPATTPTVDSSRGAAVIVAEKLNTSETYWSKLQKWLEEKGYMLRPRFREGWVPSWPKSEQFYWEYEDGLIHFSAIVMDATRISDGAPVMLKAVSRVFHLHELAIARYLSSEELASDPRNHCVPVWDVLLVPKELQGQFRNEDGEDIVVMPRLRTFDSPPFRTIGEAVEYFSQIFEGLQYIHSLNIAHRDCNSNNIMMDASPLYPNSWHPVKIDRRPNFKGRAKHSNRTAKPVKYYFIDFGLSRQYKPEERPPMEDIIVGGDKSPPEHHQGLSSCDPFPTDIYYLGNIIREEFIATKLGFDFMKPLVDDMTAEDPTARPTMDEVVARFDPIRKSLSTWKLRSRVVSRDELFIAAPFRIVPHWPNHVLVSCRPNVGKTQLPSQSIHWHSVAHATHRIVFS